MRQNADRIQRSRHRECWDLLPWLVNDTLNDAQKQRLEVHLDDCADCRREASEQKQLREHLRQEDSVLYAPQASLQKLLNRIDEAGSQPRLAPPRRFIESRYAKLMAAAVVVGAVTLVAADSISTWRARSLPEYETLTSPARTDAVPAARVVFAPAMNLDELSALLRTYRAQVVTGPTEAGVYTLVFDSPSGAVGRHAQKDEVAAAIQELRKNPQVLFAEPVGEIRSGEQP